MNPPTKYRRPVQRYRFDRKNNVVLDERRLAPGFIEPPEFDYSRGDRIFESRRSSPARLRFKTARTARREYNHPRGIARRIAAAAQKASA